MCRVAVWLHRGDSPLLLRATIHPSDANIQTIRWSSNNPNAVRVDQNGRISVAQGRKLSNNCHCS
ncbi:MAG: Ig-like domain-containing protein [Oscillospiraceae bacterium]|nr:Ig-like domain-containing protein [Oscillospiraceae bacterium]